MVEKNGQAPMTMGSPYAGQEMHMVPSQDHVHTRNNSHQNLIENNHTKHGNMSQITANQQHLQQHVFV